MSLINLQKKIGAKPDGSFGPATLRAAAKFFKLSDIRAAHFFGQTAHETGEFKRFSENLNYSKDRVLQIFKSDFDTNKDKILSESEKKKADELVGFPEKIANFVYANQNGNGDESTGDGFVFRGRGSLQLTGRGNYKSFSDYLKNPEIMNNPELVAGEFAFESAMYFFDKNKLWSICDAGVNDDTITKVSKRVNGGTNGLDHRKELTNKYYSWLTTKK